MSRLDELIAELCPNGVVYKRFDEACTLHARIGWQRLTKAEYKVAGDYMLITGTDFTSSNEVNYKSCVYVSKDRYVQDPKIQIKDGDVLITKDGTLGKVAQVNNLPMPATLNGGVFVVRPKDESLLPRYIMHFLLSGHFQKVVEQQKTGSTISHLTQTLFSRLLLPVPPLEVQREIVHILDSFTLLTAELTAELTARKKQYDFYRDKLLTFESDIPLLPIKEVVKKSCAGATPAKGNSEYYEGGTIPWIRTQDVRFNEIREVDSFITEKAVEETAAKWIPENCVIVAISGATAGRCAINKIKATTNQHCLNMQIDAEKALYKYVYYCICSKQDELISKKQGARGDLNSSLILGTKIPVPKLEIQKKIVHVLDNFDAICTDLNIGLPAEIEARQKQYEYYRDLLLTFAGTGNMLETDRQTDRNPDRHA